MNIKLNIKQGGANIDVAANSFDYIRVIAALSIITTHLLAHIPPANETIKSIMAYFNGYFYGVVTFFAISGFLIPNSIEKSKSFKFFLKKRILRLYPGIWCAFFISFFCILFLYKPELNMKRIIIWFGTQLTFFQVYTPDWLRGYGNGTPNGALWTIVVELQLYVISYFIYDFIKKLNIKQWLLIIVFAASANIVCWAIRPQVPHIIYRLIFVSFIPYFYIYLIGMFLYIYKDTILISLSQYWLIVLLAYSVSMTAFYLFLPRAGFYAPLDIGLTLPVVVVSCAYGLGKHRMNYEISYGMFLYHFIVINALIQLGLTDGMKAIFIVIPVSIMMGFIEFYLIDRPCSKIRLN